MPLMKFSAVSLTVSLLLSNCATTPTFTKRYNSILPDETTTVNVGLELSAFPVTVTRSASTRLIADLPERAQAEAIKAISRDKSVTASSVASTLSSRITAPTSSATPNFIRYSRRIGVTVDVGDISDSSLADRLTMLETNFELNSGAKFHSWSQLANPFIQVDLGDLSFEQSSSIGAEAGFDTLSPDLASLNITGELAQELTETVRLRQTVLPLYGVLSGNKAKLVQRGALGRDLVGIQTIDVVIEVEEGGSSSVVSSFTAPNEKTKTPASLTVSQIRPPKNSCPITLTVKADGIIRHVKSGHTTITESDDNIRLLKAKNNTSASYEIIEEEDLKRTGWIIENENSILKMHVLGSTGYGQSKNMVFLNRQQAENFYIWMSESDMIQSKIGKVTFLQGGAKLSKAFFEKAIITPANLTPDCNN